MLILQVSITVLVLRLIVHPARCQCCIFPCGLRPKITPVLDEEEYRYTT